MPKRKKQNKEKQCRISVQSVQEKKRCFVSPLAEACFRGKWSIWKNKNVLLVRRGCIDWGRQQKAGSDRSSVGANCHRCAGFSDSCWFTQSPGGFHYPEAFYQSLSCVSRYLSASMSPYSHREHESAHESGVKPLMQWDVLVWFQATGPTARQAMLLWWVELVIPYFIPISIKAEVSLSSFLQAVSFLAYFLTVSLWEGDCVFCLIPHSFLLAREFLVCSTARSSATSSSSCLIYPLLILPGKLPVWVCGEEHRFIRRG